MDSKQRTQITRLGLQIQIQTNKEGDIFPQERPLSTPDPYISQIPLNLLLFTKQFPKAI